MKNSIALITGGIGDIGTAICQHFLSLGAKVIAADFAGLCRFNVTCQLRVSNYGRIIYISSVNAQKGQYGQKNYSSVLKIIREIECKMIHS